MGRDERGVGRLRVLALLGDATGRLSGRTRSAPDGGSEERSGPGPDDDDRAVLVDEVAREREIAADLRVLEEVESSVGASLAEVGDPRAREMLRRCVLAATGRIRRGLRP